MKYNKQSFKLNRLLTCMLIGGCVTGTSYAAEETTSQAKEQDVEVIEVTGFRSSINAALMSKRDAVGSRETIIAEDTGKFPDLNVADSLSRVPGISIEEDAGEGRQIAIRGLGSRYVKTTINGMESASAGAATDAAGGSNKGRAFDYNIFSSDLFTQIDIDKTSSAELEDGGISGNVNLQTARPFQFDGFKASYNVNARYNDVSEETTPRVSFMASNNWDDTFGALVSVAYSEGIVQSEGATTVRWTVNNPLWDADGSPQPGGSNYLTASPKTLLMENGAYTNENLDGLYLPRIPRYSIFSKQQERLGVTAAFQYAPTDNFSMVLDILHANLDTTMDEYEYSVLLRDQKDITPENLYTDSNNTIVAGSFSNATIRTEARQDKSESTFDQYTLSGDWLINDRLTMTFLAGHGTSELDVPHSRTFALDATGSTVAYSYDNDVNPVDLVNNVGGTAFNTGSMDTGMPSFAFGASQLPGQQFTKDSLEQSMLNADNYQLGLVRNRAQTIESENTSFKVDFAYELNDEIVLKFGINHREFITEQHDYRNDWKKEVIGGDKYANGKKAETAVANLDDSVIAGGLYDSNLNALGVTFGNTASVPGTSTLSQGTWLSPDYNAVISAFSNEAFFEAREAHKRSYAIEEEVLALYAQVDFIYDVFGKELRGNVGLRYLDNENTSRTIDTSVKGEAGDIDKDSYLIIGGGDYRWLETTSSGDDVLPSLNLAYDLTDDLVARFSYSESISRPKLSDLSGALKVNTPDDEDPSATITRGAGPSLQPYKAKGYDMGLEWYFTEEALLGASVFFKDISGLTKEKQEETFTAAELEAMGISGEFSGETWEVTQLVNTPFESMWGAEFIYQQPFTFLPGMLKDFGIQANYTYVDYTRDVEDPFYGTALTLQEEETSENTYNITLYYEIEKFSARFSYNFREGYNKDYKNEYKDESTYVRGYEDKAKLNFSAAYDLSEDMAVSFEAVNLTDENQDQWNDTYTPRPYEHLSSGRQFLIGLRGSF
ncbi:MAG: TonB-dependent receptor [Colwellia sp.]